MIVDCAVYEQGRRRDGQLELKDVVDQRQREDSFVWIGLFEPGGKEFDAVAREFGLHELAVEDAVHAHQRPKLEMYGDTMFLVLKTARYVDSKEVVEFGEVLVFMGQGFIVTVRHGEGDLHGVRERLEDKPELLRCGPGAALHAILDKIVDDYAPALAGLANDIDEVESQVFSSDGGGNPAQRIYLLKREVLEFIRATSPIVDPVNRLACGNYELIHPEIRTYFRDVDDHLVRVYEQLEGYRDLLTSVLSANLTQVSVRQNEDVRKISAAVAILAVPTMIAGIYGMNFQHMPELKWTLGYPAVLVLMASICFALYRYFKRAGWL
jgi:magnesium transporter